jgi:uncharacterized protein (DUF2336 family)
MQPQSESIIAELELAVRSGSPEKRISTLRNVTDLFLNDSDHLNDDQIKVFDDVLCLLTHRIEKRALAELSQRLAPVDKAPVEVIRRLAHDAEISVAGPVLAESKRLTTEDLSEIARTQSQAHLLAISGRDKLEEAVTDVLVERGNREVVHNLSANSGARFSEAGYGILVKKADGDDDLTEKLGLRLDIPIRLLRDLLSRATEAVRAKLMSLASPAVRDEILRALAAIKGAIVAEATEPNKFAAAEHFVRAMHNEGRLDGAAVLDFVNQGKFDEVTATLALLCAAPIKVISELLTGLRNDAVLLPCKAVDLPWPTVEAILRNRHGNRALSDKVIDLARNDYTRLSVATAQKSLRFLQVRATVVK